MRTLLAAAAIMLSTPVIGSAQVDYDRMRADGRDIRMTVIADGVYQFMTQRDSYVRQLNSVAVVTDRDVLVFDTDTRPSTAALIFAEIRKITKKPVRFVVNSHGHPDHWSGTSVYADAFPDLDVIASEATEEHMRRMAGVWAPRFANELAQRRTALAQERSMGKRADGSPLTAEQLAQDESDLTEYAAFSHETDTLRRVFPTITFTDTLTLRHGGREFRFFSVMGDAEGTTVLYLPDARVVMTGDVVSFPMPYINPSLAAHAASLRWIEGLDADIIIPGHGPAFHDKKFVNLERRFAEAILAGIVKAKANGVTTVEEMQKVVTVDELREALAHGDADLEARYRQRIRDVIALAMAAK